MCCGHGGELYSLLVAVVVAEQNQQLETRTALHDDAGALLSQLKQQQLSREICRAPTNNKSANRIWNQEIPRREAPNSVV